MALSIKNKLYLLAGAVVCALLLLFLQGRYFDAEQQSLARVVETNDQLKINMLMLRRNEKDFLIRQDLGELKKFEQTMQNTEQSLQTLLSHISDTHLSDKQAQAMSVPLGNYKNLFAELANKMQEKGLDKTSGHYGRLRKATHELESHLDAQNNNEALVLLLTLRRHEKDFMLRDDPQYISRLKNTANELERSLRGDALASRLISTYVREFEAFFAISQQIGLAKTDGVKGQMRAAVHTLEEALDSLSNYYSQEAAKSLATSQMITLVLSVLISLAIVIAILYLARQLIVPIEHLSKSFEDIRKSDDLTKRVDILREDEIGHACKDFNILLDYFHAMVLKINTSVDKLEAATDTVSQSVHNTQHNIEQQNTQSDMVATAVTEMGAAAHDIAKNAELTAQTVDSAHASAEIGSNKVHLTIERVNNLAESLVTAGQAMTLLKDKSDGITSVLDVIKGIAEQTNLLALNAAIEAARAGEQGRGFAVVADEVRTLAIRTQESTSEISNIIHELQASTTDIASVVERCTTEGTSSANMAQEAGDVLEEIISQMTTVNQMTTEIATAVEEQSNVVEEVNRNVLEITQLGEAINKESNANVVATYEVSEQAKTLHDTVNIFKV